MEGVDYSLKWKVLFTVSLMTVMLNFDYMSVTIAIPDIAHQMHASLDQMQWVIIAFVAASGVFNLFGGYFGGRFGHTKTFAWSVLGFVLASMLAGLADSTMTLIVARALQGVALGCSYPSSMILIREAFPPKERGRAMGIFTSVIGFSLTSGPSLGGMIIHYFGWRWIFMVNAPIGLLCIFLCYLYCPRDKGLTACQPFDYIGALLSIIGVTALSVVLNQSQVWGIDSLQFIGGLIGSLIVLTVLVKYENKHSHPFAETALFKSHEFSRYVALRTLVQGVLITILFFVPIYLESIQGFSSRDAGFMLMPIAAALGFGSSFVGKWVDRTGIRKPLFLGLWFFVVASLLLVVLPYTAWKITVIILALSFCGMAMSLSFVSGNHGVLESAPKDKEHSVSSMYFTFAFATNTIGVALGGYVVRMVSASDVKAALASMHLSHAHLALVERMAGGMASLDQAVGHFGAHQMTHVRHAVSSAFQHGLSNAMIVMLVLALFGIWIARNIKNHPHQPDA